MTDEEEKRALAPHFKLEQRLSWAKKKWLKRKPGLKKLKHRARLVERTREWQEAVKHQIAAEKKEKEGQSE